MDKERRRRGNSSLGSPSPIGAGEQARGGLSPFSQRMQKQQAQNPSMMNLPPECGPKKPGTAATAGAVLPPGEVIRILNVTGGNYLFPI